MNVIVIYCKHKPIKSEKRLSEFRLSGSISRGQGRVNRNWYESH